MMKSTGEDAFDHLGVKMPGEPPESMPKGVPPSVPKKISDLTDEDQAKVRAMCERISKLLSEKAGLIFMPSQEGEEDDEVERDDRN